MRNRRLHYDQQSYIVKLPGSGRIWRSVGLVVLVMLAGIILFAGEKSLFKLISLYQEKDHLIARTETIRQENEKIKEQIKQLQSDPEAVEKIARDELGMVRPDEIVYRFVPSRLATSSKQQ